jgi:hypothetical protein
MEYGYRQTGRSVVCQLVNQRETRRHLNYKEKEMSLP